MESTERERISIAVPIETYRVLQQMMVDLNFRTVGDLTRELMKESPRIQKYMKEKNVDLDFGSRRWGGNRR